MEITNDLLKEKGFKCDNPKNIFTTYYIINKEKPEWRISLSRQYLPYTNKLTYNCDCWLCNDKGIIIKRASLSNINTIENLNTLIKLCNIDYQI